MRASEQNPSYLEQSCYADILDRFLEHFPDEQLLILDYEDLVTDNEATVRDVYRFLGVATDHAVGSLERRYNEARRDRGALSEAARSTLGIAQRVLPTSRMAHLRASPLAGRLWRMTTKPVDESVVPALSDEDLRELRALLVPQVRRLETMTGRSFHRWTTTCALAPQAQIGNGT